MSGPPSSPSLDALLDDLLAMTPPQRRQRVEREADPARLIEDLAQRASELAIGDTPNGERVARMAIDLADAVAADGLRARTRVALAHVLNYANRFDEALGILDESGALAERAADRFAGARGALISMHALARLGRMDDALSAGRRAIAGFDTLGEPVWRAKADVNVGVLRRMRDDPEGALAHFDAARPAFAQAPPVLAQIESNRAEALLDLGRFSEAESAFEAALTSFQSAGIARAAAIAQGNLADLLGRQGRIESSLDHFERARRVLETADAPADLARLRAEEADALSAIGMLAESAGAYREALVALERAGLTAEAARARLGLARVLARFGRGDDAARALEQAVAEFESIPNPTSAARAGVLLASMRLAHGHPDEADALLTKHADALADRPVESLSAVGVRAALHERAGDLPAALATLDAAVLRGQSLGLRPVVIDLLQQRARLRRRLGDLSGAIDDLGRAIDAAEHVRGLLQADRLRAAALGGRSDLYSERIDALLERAGRTPGRDGDAQKQQADRATAFETADRAKARALLDLVHGGAELAEQLAVADPDADPALARELSERRRDMNAIYAALFAPQERHAGPQALANLARRLDEHERRVTEIERRLASTRRLQPLHAPPATLEELRAVLMPGEALIEYFGVGKELGAAVVTCESLSITRSLASIEEVADLSDRLGMAIDRAVIALAGSMRSPSSTVVAGGASGAPSPAPLSPQAERLLRRAHDMLLAPLADAIAGADRVIIVPHGPLHAIPLHAASDAQGPLVARADVAYSPSAALLIHSRRREPRPHTLPALVVGVPDEIAPQMGDEAHAIADAIPGATLLLGPDATFDAFARAAPHARLIHLACHGQFAARSPLQARLRFSDRWATVRDLLPLNLRGSVVVLSVCESGRSGVERGDEAYGLGRALLAAGASAAVLSLWPVHDQTTRQLMISMYQTLGAGYLSPGGNARGVGPNRTAPDGALAVAQRALLARGTHPAIWAPFVVLGDPGA